MQGINREIVSMETKTTVRCTQRESGLIHMVCARETDRFGDKLAAGTKECLMEDTVRCARRKETAGQPWRLIRTQDGWRYRNL